MIPILHKKNTYDTKTINSLSFAKKVVDNLYYDPGIRKWITGIERNLYNEKNFRVFFFLIKARHSGFQVYMYKYINRI